MPANLLSQETSPYLLQHKDNPVHWRPWGLEALAEAKREDRPILLSIGYAACHWCHVMAHESFEDTATAELMNALFVNIKLDREERPDLDTIYQSALALMGQQGGWPLTMFLTPEGEPFYGGTYFPPTARFGRPGFADLLRAISRAYTHDREKVDNNVGALRDALSRLSSPQPGSGLSVELLDETVATLLRLIDPLHGGTTGAPKFPQPVLFQFLWRAYKRTGRAAFKEAVVTTLNALCQGGIYDHLGGGFARYSTDAKWLVPHFEKMLYDNALLVELMTEVWQDTHSPLLATRVRETIDWVLGDLRVFQGNGFAFAAAFDADSEGVEGKYYVWSEAEIDAVLGDDSAVFKRAYDVTADGNWEGVNILNRPLTAGLDTDAEERRLAACRARLLATRSQRVPPARDDKVLADWNGLMIAALARASMVFDRADWLESAVSVFASVTATMEIDGRLRHSWCAGQARHPAVIEDYANMARAALALFEASGDSTYLSRAQSWVATADDHHWDADAHGYFVSADDTADVISRAKTIADNATPSGNGTMVGVLARLFWLTGNDFYRQRCEQIIDLFSGDSPAYLISIPGLLAAYELLGHAVQIVIVGEKDDDATRALRKAAFSAAAPLAIISQTAGSRSLPSGHPAHGKGLVDGKPTAYVCVGPTCGTPVTDPAALSAQLTSL